MINICKKTSDQWLALTRPLVSVSHYPSPSLLTTAFAFHSCSLSCARGRLSKEFVGRSSGSRDVMEWVRPLSQSGMARDESTRVLISQHSTRRGPPENWSRPSADPLTHVGCEPR